jgi:hypothetical protein
MGTPSFLVKGMYEHGRQRRAIDRLIDLRRGAGDGTFYASLEPRDDLAELLPLDREHFELLRAVNLRAGDFRHPFARGPCAFTRGRAAWLCWPDAGARARVIRCPPTRKCTTAAFAISAIFGMRLSSDFSAMRALNVSRATHAASDWTRTASLTPGGTGVVASAVVRKRDVPREEFESEPSVDLRYRLAPEWQAMLTLNTDFSDADLDDREVKLTRFPLFLPEQRYFFVQDSDLFNFGNLSEHGHPFFSRRIALSPIGDQLDMPGGLKVVGRGCNPLVFADRLEVEG